MAGEVQLWPDKDEQALEMQLNHVKGERNALRRDVQQLCQRPRSRGWRDGLLERLASAKAEAQKAMDDRERYMEEVAIEREQLRKAVEVASQEARRARRLEEEAEARKAEAASAMAERDQAVEQIEGMRNAKSRVERHAQEVEARLASREREQAERANEHSTQMQLQLDGIGEEVERLRSQLNAALSELRAERDRRDKEGVRHRGYSGGQEEAAPPTLVEELNDLRQQARGFEEERDSFRIQLAEAMQEKVEALLLLSQEREKAKMERRSKHSL